VDFKILLFAILFLQVYHQSVLAQCSIPRADTCDQAEIICSLTKFNEFYCNTSNYQNTTGCTPLCPSGGGSRNTSWWAFRSMGGWVKIVIGFNNCRLVRQGVQLGLWADCDCNQIVDCRSSCGGAGSEFVITGLTQPCKVYYLFVNGCNGDVCDFILVTDVEKEPELPALNLAPHLTRVCEGACGVKYEVQDTFLCGANYVWTLDTAVLASKEKSVILDFPDSGRFQLCVTAYIGNPLSGNVCDQDGPVCTTIRVVDQTAERRGAEGLVCWDQIPFHWHDQEISKTGDYRQTLQDSSSCCSFDSVRRFTILDRPSVYFVGCNGDIYTDTVTNHTFSTCQQNTLIDHPGKTIQYQCDSSYLLNAVFLDFRARFSEYCTGIKLTINPGIIDRTAACGNQFTQNRKYKWFLKMDSLKQSIGTDNQLDVVEKNDYCLELSIETEFGNERNICKFEFCEDLDESQKYILYEVCPLGDSILNDKMRGNYFLDTITPNSVYLHDWQVTGGTILTKKGGIDTTGIEVDWDPSATEHKVCYHYLSNCGESKECCLPVRIVSVVKDDLQRSDLWSVVPNPASNEIRVLHPTQHTNLIEVIDHFGKSAMKIKSNLDGSFDISSLNSGMYFLKIHSDFGFDVRRLMLVR